ncbi:MAG: PQQ-binding-like beta-propeller repeat protein, partial [Planctomycetota bacterium]
LLAFAQAQVTAGKLSECEKTCESIMQMLSNTQLNFEKKEVRRILKTVSLEKARKAETELRKAEYIEKATDFADSNEMIQLLLEAAKIYEVRNSPDKALNAHQSILEKSEGISLEIFNIPNIDASGYAYERIKELLNKHGRTLYSCIEKKAKELLEKGRNTSLNSDLIKLIRIYPNSETAKLAYLDLAEIAGSRGFNEISANYLKKLLYLLGDKESDISVRAKALLAKVSGNISGKTEFPLTKVWQTLPAALGAANKILYNGNSAVFFILYNDFIDCRSLSNGTLLWRRDILKNAQAFLYDNKSIIVSINTHLLSIDSNTGGELWNYTIHEPKEKKERLPNTLPVIMKFKNKIIVWYPQFRILALNADTGEKIWETSFNNEALSVFTAGSFIVCVCASPNIVYVINPDNGEILHNIEIEGQNISSAFSLPVSGKIILRNLQELICFELASGKVLWRKPAQIFLPVFITTDTEEQILFTSSISSKNPEIYCLSTKNGHHLWNKKYQEETLKNVYITNSSIFVITQKRFSSVSMESLDIVNGTTRWTTKETVSGTPLFFDIKGHLCFIVNEIGPAGKFTSIRFIDKKYGQLIQKISRDGFYTKLVTEQSGNIVVSADSLLLGFRHVNPGVLKMKITALVRTIEKNPNNAQAYTDLSSSFYSLGRFHEAAAVIEKAVLLEDVSKDVGSYIRIFEQLNYCAFAASEQKQIEVIAHNFKIPPKIDGEIIDEWNRISLCKLNKPAYIFPIHSSDNTFSPWISKEDLSADLYLGYDNKNFYFILDVKDSILRPGEKNEREQWIGDTLLVTFDCLGDGTYSPMQDDYMISLGLSIPKPNMTDEERQEEEKSKPAGEYFVKRKVDESGVYYEGAVPWTLFREKGCSIEEDKCPKAGFTFGINFILTDDDSGGGSRKTLNLTPGVILTRGKNPWIVCYPKLFAKVILEQPAVEDK